MDGFEFNKLAGAVLSVLIFVMLLGFGTDMLFAVKTPKEPGYIIEVASVAEQNAGPAQMEEIEPIALRLERVSADDGRKLAKKCVACHVFEKDGKNRVGPMLWDIVERAPASLPDFAYSKALTKYSEEHPNWNYEELDSFLANPKKYVSGTSMSFAGLRKPDDRAALIAYLRSLSDSPASLP